jgi:hypothetical protein
MFSCDQLIPISLGRTPGMETLFSLAVIVSFMMPFVKGVGLKVEWSEEG